MPEILVTGADGQLGRSLRERAGGNWHFAGRVQLDATDAEAVRRYVAEREIDLVVNCAAYTDVDRAEEEEAAADRVNRLAARNLAEAAAQYGATLIHISTDYVFPGTGCRPCREEDPTAPTGAYGRTKLAGERAVVASGCRYLILRTSWLYSEYGRNFVKTIRRSAAERDTLCVVADQIGSPTYAGDLAATIRFLAESGRYAGHEGIYHYANEGSCSWYDFACEIVRRSGLTCDVRPCRTDEYPHKAQRPAYSVLDTTKIARTFGLAIPRWRDSLAACLEKLG